MPKTGGLSSRRCDRCPIGFFGYGVPVGRTFVSPLRGQRAHACAASGHMRAEAGSREGREVTQRAKAGYCPFCARPTHVAVPSRFVVGEFPPCRGPGSLAVDGARTLGGSILCSRPL